MNDLTSLSTPGGARIPLANQVPLYTPLLIQIFPVYACNFKCTYCVYSIDRSMNSFISSKSFMDYDLYKKCIDDLKSFSKKIKMLRFAGIGEPLLHKDLAKMIQYAKEANVAQSIDIVTNGSLLTRELSKALIKAGLTKLRVSLEGLSNEDYEKNCKVRLNFEELYNNLAFFYENRGETKVYIKIIDYMLKSEKDKERFLQRFSQICDEIAVENLTPELEEIDYNVISEGSIQYKPRNSSEFCRTNICSQPFYLMQINPDGNVVPCCAVKYPRIMGNASFKSLKEIWNGIDFDEFRLSQLKGVKHACGSCILYKYATYKEDVLDDKALYLIEKFENRVQSYKEGVKPDEQPTVQG